MFAVTGITGQIGGAAARTLLDTGLSVRAVMRDAAKGAAWKQRGCEIALADMKDAAALTAALSGVDGVFVMIPPIFDPTPGFPEVRTIIAAVTTAIVVAKPSKIVCLSTIGAQATQPNLSTSLVWWSRRWAPCHVGLLPTGRLVHGKCDLGRRAGARHGRRAELPATARQARPHGRDGRHRPPSGHASARDMDGPPHRRTRGTATHHTESNRRNIRRNPRPADPHGSRSP